MAIKSKKVLLMGIIALLLLTIMGGILAHSGIERNDPGFQLSLGRKFLKELDYENAILCFNKVITVEPKNADAFLGLADAYIGKGDTAAAVDVLHRGLEITEDSRLSMRLETMRTVIEDAAPVPMQTSDLTTEQTQVLQRLMNAFAQENLDTVRAIMESDAFHQILKSQPITDRLVKNDGYEEYSQNLLFGDTENGIGMELSYEYFIRDDKSFNTDYYAYYGKWVNGRKEGVYLAANCNEDTYDTDRSSWWETAECTYTDGLENGNFTRTREYSEIYFNEPDLNSSGNIVIHGYLVDGFLHGKVVSTDNNFFYGWEESTSFSYYENGIIIPVGPPNEKGRIPSVIKEDGSYGGYYQPGTIFWTIKWGVWGTF